MASVDTTSILNSLLESVETQLKESLREETQNLVSGAISDFNTAVKECKTMIFKEQESLSLKLKELLENEVAKHKSEYEKEISKLEIERKNAMKSFTDNLKKQMSEARNEYEELLSNINNTLFTNPNSLLKKIQNESKLLKQEREAFENLKAEYGETVLPLENDTKDEDTVTVTTTRNESNNNSNNDNGDSKTCNDINDIAIAHNDYVTIKIDDKTFCTQRRTLTQIENSKLAKLFAYKGGLLSCHKNGYYILDANPDSFKQILRLLRLRKSGRLQNNNNNNNNGSNNDDNSSDAVATEEQKDESASNDNCNDKNNGKTETKNKPIYVDPIVYQELENFGLLDTFLPFIQEKSQDNNIIINNNNNNKNSSNDKSKNSSNDSKKKKDSTMVKNDDDNDATLDDEKKMGDLDSDNINHFIIYRSNSQNTSNYFINWDASGDKDVPYSVSGDTITTMVKINDDDWSRIDILENGYYRITTRFVANINSAVHARLYINGSASHYCHRNETSTAYDKTFYFNDVLCLNSGHYFQIYLNNNSNYKSNLPKTTYLCIEKISPSVEHCLGIWQSSSSSSNYRLWNNAVKTCNLYELKTSNRDIYFKKWGLYRVCCRLHTNYSNKGNQYLYQDFFQGMLDNNMYIYSYQSTASTGYQCHVFDSIVRIDSLKDYLRLYDGGYGTASNKQYDEMSICRVSQESVGIWKSSNTSNDNHKVWNHGCSFNDLFETDDDDSSIIVTKSGYYRICAMITTYQNGDGQVSMYINGNEYCISKMGCYGGNYYHTHFINEIVYCTKNNKIRFYSTHFYSGRDYNTLFIEKLQVE